MWPVCFEANDVGKKEFVATHTDEFIEVLIIVTKETLVTRSIMNSENRPVTPGLF